MLESLERTARARGYTRLLLETGTGQEFEAAHALHPRNGDPALEAFGDYAATDFNVSYEKTLGVPSATSAAPQAIAAMRAMRDAARRLRRRVR